MLSTTPPDMATWGPWDSCMKRSALWTSKIRYLHLKHTHGNHNPRERTFDFSKAFPVLHLFSRKPSSHRVHTPLYFPLVICSCYGYRLARGLPLYEIIVDCLLAASIVSEVRSVSRYRRVKCCWAGQKCHTELRFKCSQHHYGCKLSSWNGLLSLNSC